MIPNVREHIVATSLKEKCIRKHNHFAESQPACTFLHGFIRSCCCTASSRETTRQRHVGFFFPFWNSFIVRHFSAVSLFFLFLSSSPSFLLFSFPLSFIFVFLRSILAVLSLLPFLALSEFPPPRALVFHAGWCKSVLEALLIFWRISQRRWGERSL